MSRPLTWSQLTKGLIALAVVAAIAAAVLIFARVGALHGDTSTFYMVTNTANGVIKGTEVWLGGQKVGVVQDVYFREASADTTERLTIKMDILTQYVSRIRKNSDIQIRPGTSLIGAPVVDISVGSSSAAAVTEHDTLRARAQLERRPGRAQMISALGDSLVAVANLAKQIGAKADTTVDAISQIRKRSEDQIEVVSQAITKLKAGQHSHGSVNLITKDSSLQQTLHHISAQTDSIQRLMHGSQSSLGRFRKDSTLLNQIQGVRAGINTLKQRLSPTQTDRKVDGLARELNQIDSQLDSLMKDAKRNPLKYLSL